jgi:Protein of unknown function (DUF2380)
MRLAQHFLFANPVTILFTSALVLPFGGWPAATAEKAAVFDFESMHGSVHLAGSGFEVVDIASVAEKAAAANLQGCGDCADDFAREPGGDCAVTGVVHKGSQLVPSISVRVPDVPALAPLTSAVVDIGANTDESWRCGIDYLYKNVPSPRPEKMK